MFLRRLTLILPMAAVAGCTDGGPLPATGADPQATPTTIQSTSALSSGLSLRGVPAANPRAPGLASPNVLSPELIETPVAQGSNRVENPTTVTLADGTTVTAAFYGYDGDGPLLPAAGDLPSATHLVEATKTEPDKNTYLVLYGQTGADPSYDYGTHFIFQGHELGKPGYISRINLDADGAHKVTVMAATDVTGAPLGTIDGSTWDPFAQRLIFTTESAGGPEYQATIGFPSVVEDISGAIGRGGYEGVQNDSDGNLWIVEDIGGSTSTAAPHAKVPNSFVYRFVPKHKESLKEGKLQVLQVTSLRGGAPISFHDAATDTLSADVGDLHTYGKSFATTWITIHDTDVDGTAPYNANTLAKAKLGTPFKRPENGVFRPGSKFKEFYFDETGDTNLLTEAGGGFGGFGGVFKLTQKNPSANTGTLTLFFLGDAVHTGLDNCAFLTKDQIVFGEDAGDTLHTQRNALDSAWVLDVNVDYSNPAKRPIRLLAEGRDASATLDAGFSGAAGFQNEGDNEITGFHVSNGDPSVNGILGAANPKPFKNGGWRVFYTQQHGDNFTWEILAAPGCGSDD